MAENKTYRIKINENEGYADINLNINQDIDMFEMLSLKINRENFYKLQTSNYGCIVGRVLANDAIGIPNVKLSIFIAADDETKADSVLSYLYPFSSPNSTNSDNIRYNLLTDEQVSECFTSVGTFPSKRLVLDDRNVFEIYDKYYKFTTTTNSAGDYMIFGVPLGTQQLHIDVDLSDIGDLLSQSPRDFIYKGYDVNEFESPSKFKKSTKLDSLPQIFSQNESVYVYPFWGDPSIMMEEDSNGVRITRKDINLNYKFEPTCVFLGSLITDEKSNGISKRCIPTDRMGKMDRLTTGEGTIEMIRKTADGSVESFNINGSHLIDGDGVWCYQIPMNLDFVKTDEYGNIVPTDDPNKGLPTRARVRFRVSLNDLASDYENNHLVKMLVPNNPKTYDEMSNTYVFGTATPESEFRDLLWNKVYTVKSYVPRLQKSDMNREKRFTGIKAVNVNGGNNPVPYNNMRIDITFMFILQCAIMHVLIFLASTFNKTIKNILSILKNLPGSCNNFSFGDTSCITVGDGACPDLEGWYFAPGCYEGNIDVDGKNVNLMNNTIKKIEAKEIGADTDTNDKYSLEEENREDTSVCLTNKIDYFMQCIETALAQEYEVIQFDFYNDWINGALYVPRWFANVKKKKTYLFGLLKRPEKVQACMEDTFKYQRRYTQQCALDYTISFQGDNVPTSVSAVGKSDTRMHKAGGRKHIPIVTATRPGGGFIHSEKTLQNQNVYYFRPCDFTKTNNIKVNYFATDIVLLGSLDKNDIDGIPQAFKELVSSTYKMPTNLAATNMDYLGRMYGIGSGFKCGEAAQSEESDIEDFLKNYPTLNETEKNIIRLHINSGANLGDLFAQYRINAARQVAIRDIVEKYKSENASVKSENVSKIDQTFGNYSNWISVNKDIDSSNDSSEYPFTEAAGIDWGYEGPDQEILKEKLGFTSNIKIKPGGHFLGISCSSSEASTQSCVNLSRICEIGVEASQRHQTINVNPDSPTYIIPTGVISREEINDSDFRRLFATLNINGLKTVDNPEEGRKVYEFLPIYMNNFDGSMYNLVKNTVYRQFYNHVNSGITYNSSNANIFTHTHENFDVDYYKFRMGISDFNESSISKHYLFYNRTTSMGATAYLPMYENSFYFYFGLHDGSTALDKFYEKYYAECVSEASSLVPKITVETTPTTYVSGCTDNNGTATALAYGFSDDGKLTSKIEKHINGQWQQYSTTTSGKTGFTFTFEGLNEGEYRITITDGTAAAISTFKIDRLAAYDAYCTFTNVGGQFFITSRKLLRSIQTYFTKIKVRKEGESGVMNINPSILPIQTLISESGSPGHIGSTYAGTYYIDFTLKECPDKVETLTVEIE